MCTSLECVGVDFSDKSFLYQAIQAYYIHSIKQKQHVRRGRTAGFVQFGMTCKETAGQTDNRETVNKEQTWLSYTVSPGK